MTVNIINADLGAIGSKIGDKIYDKKRDCVGTVVKYGQRGNYDLIYVDFGNKNPTSICPMDDAQISHNYYRIK